MCAQGVCACVCACVPRYMSVVLGGPSLLSYGFGFDVASFRRHQESSGQEDSGEIYLPMVCKRRLGMRSEEKAGDQLEATVAK